LKPTGIKHGFLLKIERDQLVLDEDGNQYRYAPPHCSPFYYAGFLAGDQEPKSVFQLGIKTKNLSSYESVIFVVEFVPADVFK